ncbi:MAG: hypothetical protein SFV23_06560 [Planctomycetaceae bacterium]|nr:hypothetical protein [Planctomycetaceae bacterium]
MSHETLYELLHRRPFEPFVVRLTSGESHEIRHPEMALLLKTKLVVGQPDSDRMAICSLLHITQMDVSVTA